MSKRLKEKVKKFVIFIGLLLMGHLADNLPESLWSIIIQIGLYGSALIMGVKLLMAVNQSIDNEHIDKK